MALQFTNTGYITFNKKYNTVLKSGAISASMSTRYKDKDSDYLTGYFNIMIVKDVVNVAKEAIKNNELVTVTGFAVPAKKGYMNYIVTEIIKPETEESNNKELEEDDLPF